MLANLPKDAIIEQAGIAVQRYSTGPHQSGLPLRRKRERCANTDLSSGWRVSGRFLINDTLCSLKTRLSKSRTTVQMEARVHRLHGMRETSSKKLGRRRSGQKWRFFEYIASKLIAEDGYIDPHKWFPPIYNFGIISGLGRKNSERHFGPLTSPNYRIYLPCIARRT
jgi:hypothetical protein